MKKSDLINQLNSFSSDDFEIIFEHTVKTENGCRVVADTAAPVIGGGTGGDDRQTVWIAIAE